MIPVKMADEDVADLVGTKVIAAQLVLTRFTAVDEEVVMMDQQELRRCEAPVNRQRSAGTEDRQSKVHMARYYTVFYP